MHIPYDLANSFLSVFSGKISTYVLKMVFIIVALFTVVEIGF